MQTFDKSIQLDLKSALKKMDLNLRRIIWFKCESNGFNCNHECVIQKL